jgi:hypothetical protein
MGNNKNYCSLQLLALIVNENRASLLWIRSFFCYLFPHQTAVCQADRVGEIRTREKQSASNGSK